MNKIESAYKEMMEDVQMSWLMIAYCMKDKALELETELTAVTEQRDRLAVALEQWQPIETAPKDRSFILSAHPEHGYLITRWLGAREMWDGWAIEPTHWMSLPKLTTP